MNQSEIKNIAVLTSGGDAPGMNAAIRAVVRVAHDAGVKTYGVRHGFEGLINDDIKELGTRDVSGIVQLGGTVLGTSRSENFFKDSFQNKSIQNLENRNISGLIVIGGSGSQQGSYALSEKGFSVNGVASTIDNDLYGSDISIGVDTALDTIVESVDKIKTTAKSHDRAFLVEVMGRKNGYLAIMAGVACGAEVVITPEKEMSPDDLALALRQAHDKGKGYALVLVSDGAVNSVEKIKKHFIKHKDNIGFDLRITILGYVQRGGAPTSFDRLLATGLAVKATEALIEGNSSRLFGFKAGKVNQISLKECISNKKVFDIEMWNISKVLAE